MEKYVKVKSEIGLVRDLESNAIVNRNKSEFDKFLKLSESKYQEKQEYENLKNDVSNMKNDIEEIKNLLKVIASK
jgi:hypothetical protein